MVSDELLFDYGFLNKEGKKEYGHLSIEERKKARKEIIIDVSKLIEVEKKEFHSVQLSGKVKPSGYPKSARSYRLVYENYAMSIEEIYYWIFNQLTVSQGFKKEEVIKITDVFSASEMSSYWGVNAQRLAIQQDRAAQYLRFIADMVKTMFQLIRDLNIVDEKLDYYEKSFGSDEKIAQDAEIVLKGQYTDLVEGGTRNPSSIFGMAQQLNFVTLPNLFFATRIPGKKIEDIENKIGDKIKSLPFGGDNHTFKQVLQRKLSQFYHWKFRTYKQLKTYRKLYKSYLKQHYNSIRLYMQWVKPYLKNIKKLTPGNSDNAQLISAFENELIEIEIIAQKDEKGAKACVLVNYKYRVVPQQDYIPHSQERRSTMVGNVEVNLRAYGWKKEQLENYRKMKEAEDFELLKDIDVGIKEGLDSVQDDIKKYLEEKEDGSSPEKEIEKKWVMKKGKLILEENKVKKNSSGGDSILDLFLYVIKGFLELNPLKFKLTLGQNKTLGKKSDVKGAERSAKFACWFTYKFLKKSHRWISW